MGKQGFREQLPYSLKLSILTQFYPPDYAATGQLIYELANYLGQQGIQVYLFTGQPGYAFQETSAPSIEKSGRVLVRRSRTSRLWSKRIRGKAINGALFCLRAGLNLLKPSHRGDVLLLTTAPPYLPILGYFLNRLFGISYICLLYDLYPDIAIQLNVVSPQHWVSRIWKFLNRQTWEQAREIIVLSPTMKERVIQACPTVAHKISVIHNWANPQRIQPINKSQNWFAQKHQFADQFTVLYSGNLGRCHDADTILEAAIDLANDPVQFVFIGNGVKHSELMHQVQQLKLSNCKFLPYQDPQLLPYSLTACDLSLVTISPGMEGLIAPSKFYSCLATGRPVAVICEPHSYLRPLLIEANCGQAFDHGDSQGLAHFIRTLSQHPHLAAQLGQSGRQYLQTHFTLEQIGSNYVQVIYKAALTGSMQRPLQRKPSNKVDPLQL